MLWTVFTLVFYGVFSAVQSLHTLLSIQISSLLLYISQKQIPRHGVTIQIFIYMSC